MEKKAEAAEERAQRALAGKAKAEEQAQALAGAWRGAGDAACVQLAASDLVMSQCCWSCHPKPGLLLCPPAHACALPQHPSLCRRGGERGAARGPAGERGAGAPRRRGAEGGGGRAPRDRGEGGACERVRERGLGSVLAGACEQQTGQHLLGSAYCPHPALPFPTPPHRCCCCAGGARGDAGRPRHLWPGEEGGGEWRSVFLVGGDLCIAGRQAVYFGCGSGSMSGRAMQLAPEQRAQPPNLDVRTPSAAARRRRARRRRGPPLRRSAWLARPDSWRGYGHTGWGFGWGGRLAKLLPPEQAAERSGTRGCPSGC